LSSLNETPSKIVELKKEMWRKNEKVNSQDEDEYYQLYGEEESDDEDSESESRK
jgi:hypothetical protein